MITDCYHGDLDALDDRFDLTMLVIEVSTLDRGPSSCALGFGDLVTDSLLCWFTSISILICTGLSDVVTFILCVYMTLFRAVTVVTHLLSPP